METSPTFMKSSSGGNTHPLEWFFRIGILGGLVFLGFKLINYIAPVVEEALKNIWYTAALGIPLVMLVLFIIKNPMFIVYSFNGLCRKITGWIVKLDPISIMESHSEQLDKDIIEVGQIKEGLEGKKITIERKIEQLNKDGQHKMDLAKAARQLNRESEAVSQSSMALQYKQSIELYTPMLNRFVESLTFLDKLMVNWKMSSEQLKFTIERKKEEWEMLRDMASALNKASSFVNGNTEEAKLYDMSVRALEEKVTAKMGYINEFKKNAKGIMEQMDLEKLASDQAGLRALDENQNLFMADNLFEFKSTIPLTQGEDGVYAMKSNSNGSSNNKYANTLK